MAGLVSICCCAGGRLMSDVFRQAFALSSAHCSVLEGLNVVWLVSICRCNDGKFMSVRKAFGLALYPMVFLSRYLSGGTW